MGDDGLWESDWGLGAPVATSAKAAAADALLADTDADVGGRGIEVLLPDGEQELDAERRRLEDFVRWMQSKVETEAAEPKAKVGGGRAARRRAAARGGGRRRPPRTPSRRPRAATTRGSRRRPPSAAGAGAGAGGRGAGRERRRRRR